MERESMVFYKSFFEAIDSLPEEEQAKCYRAVINYGLTGEEPEKGTLGYTMWLAFRKQIDVNQKRFENSKKRKKANSDHSATKTEPNCDQTATNIEPNVNVNDNVNVNENVNVNVNAEDVSSPNGEDMSAKPTYGTHRVPYQDIVRLYMDTCPSLPRVQKMNDTRRRLIKGRYQEGGMDEIAIVFEKAEASDFLTGRSGNWGGCGFDWLMEPAHFTKVLEGNYDNKSSPNGNNPNPFLDLLNNGYGRDGD